LINIGLENFVKDPLVSGALAVLFHCNLETWRHPDHKVLASLLYTSLSPIEGILHGGLLD
jgi:hypothetical protein